MCFLKVTIRKVLSNIDYRTFLYALYHFSLDVLKLDKWKYTNLETVYDKA